MRTWFTAVLLSCIAIFGCDSRRSYYSPAPVSGPPVPGMVERQYLLSAMDFDLESAIGLLRTNKVGNAQELEAAINGSSGLNNVDIDHDGQIDYIGVREQQNASGGRELWFVALPSSRNGDPVTIAKVTFTDANNQVTVAGGYTSVVQDYNNAYYSYSVPRGPTFGQMLFYSWLFSPRPVYVYQPYYGFTPRPILRGSVLSSTRTTYRQETRVAPVTRQAPPAGYTTRAIEKIPSRYASPSAPAPNSGVTGRASNMRDFQVRDSSRPRPNGTAFGASPSTPPRIVNPPSSYRPSSPAPTYRPSTPTYRPSAPAPSSRPSFRSTPSPSFRGGGRR